MRLFFVVGPSGVGKDTLLSGAIAADPALHWARRAITRPESAGGEPFEGVTEAEFSNRLARGDFALHWDAHGLSYGVPHTELPLGRDVLLNGSRAAIAQALAAFPGLRIIHITAPVPVLAERLLGRGRESRDQIEARLIRADQPLHAAVPVIEIANDTTPEAGVARLLQALRA
ncbi:phosphonate metabolism protein/1,5-bisphosphokinase (PRPP-forming) PhnN [Pseudotabrizicola alkalilacus]|uniref:Ribose 1,5-bisphosphate phosphokinase PhnN n=1 Tax=Pseudotabrizicola alkalilacus TaxID=2305252 RepID=A0A411Z0E5_9RHOB|nr:phosphonate metabolism protein/1,5-bisphosphokinase (PRPP-forming) PhnN [Pseudotabrizicola alkalilacus]RGP36522.1 phosphonate metabolism protein/1,5-bisphosphokinase (PRPP-forming) PhnN [Pseudotabrizicola alkalilacus]